MMNTDVVRGMFDVYLQQDRATAERLLADDLTFTSPQDDHIDRNAYFDRCFPTSTNVSVQEVLFLVDLDDDHVVVVYQYDATTGDVHRNTEIHTVRDGRVHEIQVFFGGKVR